MLDGGNFTGVAAKELKEETGIEIKELRVDGGATQNNLLLQFQADILKASVVRPDVTEVTAIGAAYLAGLAVGFWENIEQIQEQWQINRRFEPGSENNEELVKGWYRAIRAVNAWTESF